MSRTALILLLACLAGNASGADERRPLHIAYTNWSSSIASANLVCAVLRERLQHPCQLHELDPESMWRAVAEGRADAMLSAWLPDTHAHFMAEYGEQLVDLGPNLEGTRTGLVVPAVSAGRQTASHGRHNPQLVPASSIADLRALGEQLQRRIIGIDPQAGIMRAARRAIEAYDLAGFRVVPGSEQTMTRTLADAIGRQRAIVVTGWQPHWMFDRWALRFLDDPLQSFGGGGRIHTLVRMGLEEAMPRVHRVLDRFAWQPAQMNRLLVWIHEDGDLDPYAQAVRWMRDHPQLVDDWLAEETP